MNDLVNQFYHDKISQCQLALKAIDKTFVKLYVLRLILFCSFLSFFIWFLLSSSTAYLFVISIVSFFLFLAVVIYDLKMLKQQKLVQKRLELNRNELEYLSYNFSKFDKGNEFVELNPHLSEDFDLFGESSIFQYINRTVTKEGKLRLAQKLCFWENNAEIVREKQGAVDELSQNVEFLESFQAKGMLNSEKGDEQQELLQWLKEPPISLKSIRTLLFVYPIFLLVWIILVVNSIFTFSSLIFPFFIAYFIVLRKQKVTNSLHNKLGRNAKIIGMYESLLSSIESHEFASVKLQKLKLDLQRDDVKAGESLKSLFKLLEFFDFRYNAIVAALLNVTFLFDFWLLLKLEKWKSKHRTMIPLWLDVMGEIDSLSGFARFKFNHKNDVVFPTLTNEAFTLSGVEMGHPLIDVQGRVNNSFEFTGKPKVVVVTGANMAGKSTFLRTVAVNLILGVNGAPVCAKSMHFSPCDIMSSITIRDSLSHKASYFYSELTRIRQIIEHVETNPRTLVVLDEILRGTNTKDKQAGSLGLLEKLINMNAIVIIATHDLVIGELDKKYPEIVVNHCFEVELEENELVFDYKLKNGISKKLNASFLMKKMGIID